MSITWLYIAPTDRGESSASPARLRPIAPRPLNGASTTPTREASTWADAPCTGAALATA